MVDYRGNLQMELPTIHCDMKETELTHDCGKSSGWNRKYVKTNMFIKSISCWWAVISWFWAQMLCATAAASDLICTECGDDVNSVSLFRELAACWQTEDEEEEV